MSTPRDGRRAIRHQAQAVLRRPDQHSPLRLAGVLVAGSFYPATAQDAWGPLHLERGLVALAPLEPIEVAHPDDAAALALREARRDWTDGDSADGVAMLRWRPMGDVRVSPDARPISELLALMVSANEARLHAVPSTEPYHGAARELEDLASVVYDTARSEERIAEDDALERTTGTARTRPDPTDA